MARKAVSETMIMFLVSMIITGIIFAAAFGNLGKISAYDEVARTVALGIRNNIMLMSSVDAGVTYYRLVSFTLENVEVNVDSENVKVRHPSSLKGTVVTVPHYTKVPFTVESASISKGAEFCIVKCSKKISVHLSTDAACNPDPAACLDFKSP